MMSGVVGTLASGVAFFVLAGLAAQARRRSEVLLAGAPPGPPPVIAVVPRAAETAV